MAVEVIQVDYKNPQHATDLVALLSHYARDPMGGGKDLTEEVKSSLVSELAAFPTAFSVLAYVDNKPAGLINCIDGFSTFAARPLTNIHDVMVSADCRGMGISQSMLKLVEKIAVERGCCKLTLEVLEGNEAAKRAYLKYGFSGYELDPKVGKAVFWQKPLKSVITG